MRRKFTKTPLRTAGGRKRRTFPEIVALIHSELSEALEEYRSNHGVTEVYQEAEKPEGVPIELADAIIRILDYCGYAGIDIVAALERKHEYNKSPPIQTRRKTLLKAYISTNNILKGKGKMKAYKGFNKDMTCRGFQYEIGKTYETDEADLCNSGFTPAKIHLTASNIIRLPKVNISK